MRKPATYQVTVQNGTGHPLLFSVYEKDGGLVLNRLLSDVQQVVIPAEIGGKPVTEIGAECFFGMLTLRAVTIPDSVREIGDSAFALCKLLEEIIIPDSVTEIRERAFRDCRSLRHVRLSANMKILRSSVFSFCALVEPEFEIPEGLEVIEPHAFYSGGFFTLHLPDSVREIGIGAFCFGPKAVTRLPYDKGWYLDFPYGETVVLEDGRTGRVEGYKDGGHGCLILHTDFDGEDIRCFYPCADGSYTLADAESQKLMERTAGRIPELHQQHQMFENGYI